MPSGAIDIHELHLHAMHQVSPIVNSTYPVPQYHAVYFPSKVLLRCVVQCLRQTPPKISPGGQLLQ